MLNNLTRKLNRNIEDYGIWISIKKTILYPLRLIYENRFFRIYFINLEQYQPTEIKISDFHFRLIDKSDKEIIKQIESMEEWLRDQVEKKLDSSQSICLVAMDGNRVAGFNLISFGRIYVPLLKMDKEFKKDEAWSEQITVHKNYRQMGLASALRYEIFNRLKMMGINKLTGGTLRSNKASLQLARKVGFKEIMDIHYWKILGYKKYFYKEIPHENLSTSK